MKVIQILQAKAAGVITIWPGASLRSASELMANAGVGALVVLDESGGLSGLISERDIVRAVAHDGDLALAHSVKQTMTSSVITCAKGDVLTDLMAVMTRRRVRHLPVVDAGQVVGLVSIGDLVKARLQELEVETAVMRDAYLRVR